MSTAPHFIFADEHSIPNNFSGIILNYECVPISNKGCTYFDVRETISEHEEKWLHQIKNWHHKTSQLISTESKNWWLCPGSRLIFWKSYNSNSFGPLLFSLGAIKIFITKNKNLLILNAPKEVREYINEWVSREFSIQPTQHKIKVIYIKILFSIVKLSAKLLIQFSRAIWLYLNSSRHKKISSDMLVYSTIFNADFLKKSGDHFFGNFFDNFNAIDKGNLLWVYADSLGEKKYKKSFMHKYRSKYIFFDSYLSISSIIRSLFSCIFTSIKFITLIKKIPRLCIDEFHIETFTNRFIQKLIIENSTFNGYLDFYKFKNLLLSTENLKYIVYPYEEHIAEHALLMAISATGSRVRTLGFIHSSINQGHLYLDRPSIDFFPRPDKIGVTSEKMIDFLVKKNFSRESIISIGSPRYTHPIKPIYKSTLKQKTTLLVIFSFGFEYKIFTKLICSNKSLLNNYNLKLRGSFHSWRHEQTECEELLKHNAIDYYSANGDLLSEIEKSDVVMFDITTAGLQASLFGKYVIRLSLNETFKTKLLFDNKEKQYIKQFNDIKIAFSEIEKFLSLKNSLKSTIISLQQEEAMKILTPPLPKKLSSLLGIN